MPPELVETLKRCKTLPSVPWVTLKVIELAQSDDSSIADIVAVVNRDPVLSAKILKLASSSAYATRVAPSTVERAISLIGINATMCVALSFSLVRGLAAADSRGFNHMRFWRRAILTAVAARTFAQAKRLTVSSEMYMAGLLQDIGMLAMHACAPARYDEVVAAAAGDHYKLAQLEIEAFGCDHADVGAWLLREWKLPANLVVSVAASHGRAVDGDNTLVALTQAAGQLAELSLQGTPNPNIPLDPEALGIPGWDNLLSSIFAESSEEMARLDVVVEDTMSLLDHAREMLLSLNLQANERARVAEAMAHIDPLTRLRNRTGMQKAVDEAFASACASQHPLSVIFVDLDHFKHVNDNYGHPAGDAVLLSVSEILQAGVRGADAVARFGGEEFVVLLPNTGPEAALRVAERLRATIAAKPHDLGNTYLGVTASLGVASVVVNAQTIPQDVLTAADKCLYEAKRAGRNRVVCTDLDLSPVSAVQVGPFQSIGLAGN